MQVMSKLTTLKGFFAMKTYRKGKLIDVYRINNHIVNGAYQQLAHLIGGGVDGRFINRIAFGTNGKEPEDADQEITNQYARPVLGYNVLGDGRLSLVQISWELEMTENNGMGILELGLLTGDDTLFARITRTKPLWKHPDISLEGVWTIALSEEAVAAFEAGNYGGQGNG